MSGSNSTCFGPCIVPGPIRYLEAMYGLGDGVARDAAAVALAQAKSAMWMDWILYGGDFGPAFGTANHRYALGPSTSMLKAKSPRGGKGGRRGGRGTHLWSLAFLVTFRPLTPPNHHVAYGIAG